jgi:ferredoxin
MKIIRIAQPGKPGTRVFNYCCPHTFSRMSSAGQGVMDQEYLAGFFHDNNIDDSAVVSPSSLHAPEGRRPADLLPDCRTVILFGRVMGEELFSGSSEESARNLARFKSGLNETADVLVKALRECGSRAMAVRSVTVRDGVIRGGFSLKHGARDAGLGSIGESTLLLSPRFGNRLALAAVFTDRDFDPYPTIKLTDDLCHHCFACAHSCPENVLMPGHHDLLRCRNVTGGLPPALRPIAILLLRSNLAAPFLNPLVNRIASTSTPRCSLCLMACPHYDKGER